MDGPGGYYTKFKNPDTQRQILHNLNCIRNRPFKKELIAERMR
jgi:hypothetical protein